MYSKLSKERHIRDNGTSPHDFENWPAAAENGNSELIVYKRYTC
jgi:hypothetical protein